MTNKLEAELKETMTKEAERLFKQLEDLRKSYWESLQELQTTGYSSKWEQMDDIRKVSQLGLAVVAIGKAYSALNAVRCN